MEVGAALAEDKMIEGICMVIISLEFNGVAIIVLGFNGEAIGGT